MPAPFDLWEQWTAKARELLDYSVEAYPEALEAFDEGLTPEEYAERDIALRCGRAG